MIVLYNGRTIHIQHPNRTELIETESEMQMDRKIKYRLLRTDAKVVDIRLMLLGIGVGQPQRVDIAN